MPTGYTSKLVEKGQKFPEFVMTCARAFGALITMREESLDTPIPDKFEPSDYYKNRIKESEDELLKLQIMTNNEKIIFGESKKQKKIEDQERYLLKEKKENKRLEEMEKKVISWKPPTSEHIELKNFMLNQINISKNNLDWIEKTLITTKSKSPLSYYLDSLNECERNISYQNEEYAKEIERTNSRTKWIQQLRKSINKKK